MLERERYMQRVEIQALLFILQILSREYNES